MAEIRERVRQRYWYSIVVTEVGRDTHPANVKQKRKPNLPSIQNLFFVYLQKFLFLFTAFFASPTQAVTM